MLQLIDIKAIIAKHALNNWHRCFHGEIFIVDYRWTNAFYFWINVFHLHLRILDVCLILLQLLSNAIDTILQNFVSTEL